MENLLGVYKDLHGLFGGLESVKNLIGLDFFTGWCVLKTFVIYDISDDRMREGLREHIRNYGLRRVQYSGFLGEMSPHDRFVLSREVGRYLSSERDSIYIIPLCSRCVRLCRIISKRERGMEPEIVEIVD